jgi:hypothetical protein
MRRIKKILLPVLYVAVLLGLGAFGGLYFKKYQDLKKNPPSADVAAQAQVDKTVAEVGKLYQLPKDEKPSVATVKDINKLKDQPFFAKAQNDDVTLIYSNAKLAILYRPSTKQIVNVSSVTIQDNPVIKVYGPGRAAVQAKLIAAQVAATDGGDVTTSLTGITVVDVSGKNATQAQSVATAVGGQVGQLPEGQTKPEGVDIAIYAQ